MSYAEGAISQKKEEYKASKVLWALQFCGIFRSLTCVFNI